MSENYNRRDGNDESRRPANSNGQFSRREGESRPRFSRPRRFDGQTDNRDHRDSRDNYGNPGSSNYGVGRDQRRTGYASRRSDSEGIVDNQQRLGRPRFKVQRDDNSQYSGARQRSYDAPRYGNNRQNGYSRSDRFDGRGGEGQRPAFDRERPAFDRERRSQDYRPRYDADSGERLQQGSFSRRSSDRSATSSRDSLYSKKKQFQYRQQNEDPTKPIRLNKFLANAGFCSRREADDFISAGVVTVNGQVVSTLGAKVLPTDDVMFNSQHVRRERKVYVLLNKPKNTVTTSDDPQGRQTVLDIVGRACSERIYPVGRLDRNTTGVLLLTNDGDLAAKLTHPKFGKKKIYAVTLDHDLTEDDEQQVRDGIMLDDEVIVPDALEFTKDDRRHLGLEIHSGQNRVVRRIFEKIGYKVMQLDRVSFAGLTKKNLPRGKFRFLTPKEVSMLQMGAF